MDAKSEDEAAVQAAMDRITKSSHKMAEILYKQAQSPGGDGAQEPAPGGEPGGTPGGTSGHKGDDVIDAEFSEDK